MPSYYFHLAFELHRQSALASETISSDGNIDDCLIPPRNFDIFRSRLPTDRVSTWAAYIAPKPECRTSESKRKSLVIRRSSTSQGAISPATNHTSSADPFVYQYIHSASIAGDSPSSSNKISKASKNYWRFDKITMESFDMEPKKSAGANAELEQAACTSDSSTPREDVVLRGKYVPSNPRTTELGYGVVHLYRDVAESPELGEGIKHMTGTNKQQPADIPADLACVDKQCTTLCILAVPSYMTPSDLLGWLGEDTREIVKHFRLVRTGRSNRYMVLLKFRSAKATKRWQKEWNGKLFNSTEV